MSLEKIKIEHAEDWVDTMPVQSTPGGTLNVSVEITSNNHGRHFLHKKVPQGINSKILLMDIKLSNLDIYISNPQRMTYSQGLQTSNEYSSLEIFYEGEKLTGIDKIPIIK